MCRQKNGTVISLLLILGLFVGVIAFSGSSYGAEKIVIRIGFTSDSDSPPARESKFFKKILEEKFPGRINVQVFPTAQLGKGTEMLQNIKMGNLEMGLFISETPALDMRLGFLDLSWLFDSVAHFQRVVEGPVGKDMLSIVEEKGIKALGIYWNGFRNVGTVKKPIKRLEDMKGLKIRIAPNPSRTATFKAFGAAPTKIPSGEVYTALQMGVVDGAEATTFVWSGHKWDEVVDYFTVLNYSCQPNVAMMSGKFWNSLPKDIQKGVEETSDAVAKWSYKVGESWNKGYLGMLNKRVKIIEITPDALSEFKKAVKPVNQGFRKEYGDKWFEEVEKAR
jgi:tripartite ATP-independent transporter DctP family solute receptor